MASMKVWAALSCAAALGLTAGVAVAGAHVTVRAKDGGGTTGCWQTSGFGVVAQGSQQCTLNWGEMAYWKVPVPSAKGQVTGHVAGHGHTGQYVLRAHVLVRAPNAVVVNSSAWTPLDYGYSDDINVGTATAGTNDVVFIELKDKMESGNTDIVYVATIEANY